MVVEVSTTSMEAFCSEVVTSSEVAHVNGKLLCNHNVVKGWLKVHWKLFL